MATMEGGCLCGDIRYRVSDEYSVTHCHCIHCRKLGGTAFVTWVEAECANFEWLRGRPAAYTTRPGVTRRFCSRCGSPLTYERADSPDHIDVTAGTLDDPSGLKPDDHVWFDRKVPWLKVDDGLPRYGLSRGDSPKEV